MSKWREYEMIFTTKQYVLDKIHFTKSFKISLKIKNPPSLDD